MKEMQILIGNIGSGKSTYCKEKVKEEYIIISKDDLRYSIGAGNYIFNLNYEQSISNCMLEFFHSLSQLNDIKIIIDETNMDKESRKFYLYWGKYYKYTKIAMIFPSLTKEESVKRRLQSNHGNTSKEVWDEVWERKNTIYEEPTKEEGFDIIMRRDT